MVALALIKWFQPYNYMRIKCKLFSALNNQIIIQTKPCSAYRGEPVWQKALISINLQALFFREADKKLFHLSFGPEWLVVLLAVTDKSG